MVADTRFAPGPAGPIAYRLDGDGDRWLLVVGDRADPYGAPGVAAYDTFAGTLAGRGWHVLTVLDGRGPGATATASGTDERIGAIRSVAEAAAVVGATILGVGRGAAPAALSAAAAPEWAGRLILYGSFAGEAQGADWAIEPATGASDAPPALPMKAKDRDQLAAELREASESLRVARELWNRFRRTDAAGSGKPGPPARTTAAGALSGLASLIPREGPLAGLGELVRRPDRWEGGLEELMRQVSELEGGDGRHAEDLLSQITLPAIVAETSGEGDSAGLAVAARIHGARHRALGSEPDLPWAVPGPTPAFLALLEEDRPPPAISSSQSPAGSRILATLLFTDIVASTERLAQVGDAAWRELLGRHHAVVRDDLARFGGREIDNAGDGFLASFATPAPAIGCALAAISELAAIGLAIRCGLHTGECEQIGGKLGGIAVHIGARIAAKAGAGEILVSGTVRDLVAGSGIEFADRGMAELKGLPGTWPIYAVTGTEGGMA